MTFSEQFRDVLNALCEKVGIVIDWTQENIIPYFTDLLERYVKYNIIAESLWIILGIVFIISCIPIGISILKQYNIGRKTKEENFWWNVYGYLKSVEPKGHTIAALVSMGMIAICILVMVPISISELLKWCFIPEIKIIEEITSFISAM